MSKCAQLAQFDEELYKVKAADPFPTFIYHASVLFHDLCFHFCFCGKAMFLLECGFFSCWCALAAAVCNYTQPALLNGSFFLLFNRTCVSSNSNF
jgi:hypothetical protein